MMKNKTLKKMIPLVGMTVLGIGMVNTPSASAKTTYSSARSKMVKLAWDKPMGHHKMYSTSKTGYAYSAHLSARYFKLKEHPKTTWTTLRHRKLVNKKTGHRYYYYQVQSGNKKLKVWVNRSYLKQGTNPYYVKSSNNSNSSSSSSSVSGTHNGSTFNQKSNALASYKSKDFKTLNNSNYYMDAYSYAPATGSVFQTTPTSISKTKGNGFSKFESSMFLPVTVKSSGDWGNPQSVVFKDHGDTAYIMYSVNASANTGFVARYDMKNIKRMIGNNMAMLRKASWNISQGKGSASDKQLMSYIKVGPTFTTGHGQSMARNPKTGEIWFVKASSGNTSTVQRLDSGSLTPNATVNFTMGNSVPMGSNLTFDDNGNAYFWSKTSSSSYTPSGTVKIYKGSIKTTGVTFKLVMQGIQHSAGYHVQSIGYNSADGRLYMVSDGSIQSVPVSKLGKLTNSDVHTANYNGKREFEGLKFVDGTPYLLSNRHSELMIGR